MEAKHKNNEPITYGALKNWEKEYKSDKSEFNRKLSAIQQAVDNMPKRIKKNFGNNKSTDNTSTNNTSAQKKEENNSNERSRCDIVKLIYDIAMLLIAVVTLIVTIWIGFTANEITERNQVLLLSDVTIDNNEEENDFYTCSFTIAQGKIKKAYLITTDDTIHYSLLDSSLKGIRIPKNNLNVGLKLLSNDLGKNQFIKGIKLNPLAFTLAILDYTNNWTCFFVLIQPEITTDYILKLELYNIDNETPIAEKSIPVSTTQVYSKIIDTYVLNKSFFEEQLQDYFNTIIAGMLSDIDDIELSINEDGTDQPGHSSISTNSIKIDSFDSIKVDAVYDAIVSIYKELR